LSPHQLLKPHRAGRNHRENPRPSLSARCFFLVCCPVLTVKSRPPVPAPLHYPPLSSTPSCFPFLANPRTQIARSASWLTTRLASSPQAATLTKPVLERLVPKRETPPTHSAARSSARYHIERLWKGVRLSPPLPAQQRLVSGRLPFRFVICPDFLRL
jgi:hypothetical protein